MNDIWMKFYFYLLKYYTGIVCSVVVFVDYSFFSFFFSFFKNENEKKIRNKNWTLISKLKVEKRKQKRKTWNRKIFLFIYPYSSGISKNSQIVFFFFIFLHIVYVNIIHWDHFSVLSFVALKEKFSNIRLAFRNFVKLLYGMPCEEFISISLLFSQCLHTCRYLVSL